VGALGWRDVGRERGKQLHRESEKERGSNLDGKIVKEIVKKGGEERGSVG